MLQDPGVYRPNEIRQKPAFVRRFTVFNLHADNLKYTSLFQESSLHEIILTLHAKARKHIMIVDQRSFSARGALWTIIFSDQRILVEFSAQFCDNFVNGTFEL